MMARRYRMNEEMGYLLPLLIQIREDHPTMSCRAMYNKINPAQIGRDKFEKLCSDLGFKIEPSPGRKRTTDSTGVKRYENLLKDKALTSINQAFSSDITYYEVGQCFYYLTFIMDCYSRRILGYSVSGRLTAEQTTIPAIKMAIAVRKKNGLPEGIIFHSDGGGQYYDRDFLNLTARYKFQNSMCEFAYENGKAERLNGVIKNNYLKYCRITSLQDLIKSVDRAVTLYNEGKPHKSLNYKTPIMFENTLLTLNQSTPPRVKKSFEAFVESRGIEPLNSMSTPPPVQMYSQHSYGGQKE